MNEAFISAVQGSGISQYQLARNTGVPFSTINGFMNQTHDVNRCAASTMCVLAWALGKPVEELLNRYSILDKVHGNYRGLRYIWKKEDDDLMSLCFKDEDETICIKTPYKLDHPSRMELYPSFAELYIDEYLDEKEMQNLLEEV